MSCLILIDIAAYLYLILSEFLSIKIQALFSEREEPVTAAKKLPIRICLCIYHHLYIDCINNWQLWINIFKHIIFWVWFYIYHYIFTHIYVLLVNIYTHLYLRIKQPYTYARSVARKETLGVHQKNWVCHIYCQINAQKKTKKQACLLGINMLV